MSAIGPDLPPHLLAKRKRQEDDQASDEPTTASGAKRSSSPGGGEKRRRVIGPAMPPAPLDEQLPKPAVQSVQSDSDEDDDFGPALSPTEAASTNIEDNDTTTATASASPEKLRRDDWMMMPPKQDDLAARMDLSKQRARGFNTGKGAKGPNAAGNDSSAWNETPEQRQKRLRDEMMGVAKPEPAGPPKVAKSVKTDVVDPEAKEQIASEKARGPSLMYKHKQTTGPEAEDDPSKRAFDRDKDMSTGMKIGHAQRKELLNKAAGFSSKFSGGSYL